MVRATAILRAGVAAIGLIGLAATQVSADVVPPLPGAIVTYDDGTKDFRTNTGDGKDPNSQAITVSVPQFDPALGKLTMARIAVTQEIWSTIKILPSPRSGAIITAISGSNDPSPVFPSVTTQATTGPAEQVPFLNTPLTTNLASNGGAVKAVYNSTTGQFTQLPSDAVFLDNTGLYFEVRRSYTTFVDITDPSQLQALTGTGTLDYLVYGQGRSFFSTSTGSGGAVIQTQARSTISVQYVPEPSSLALLGLGAVSSIVLARRHRRRAA